MPHYRHDEPHDANQLGKLIVDISTGEVEDRAHTPEEEGKDPAAALSVALHYMHYNFCRIHKTLRMTPAMAAGVTNRLWDVKDIVAVLESWERRREIEQVMTRG